MLRNISLLILICALQTMHAEIVIRSAAEHDLEGLMKLDREVSWEFFKPLFLEYSDLPLAHNADAILEKELAGDHDMFVQGIKQQDGNRLDVAVDDTAIVGFIAYQQEDVNVHINLIFVHKVYRQQKLGKRLLERVLSAFPEGSSCTLIVLDKNISARRLYESYGFKLQPTPEAIKQELPADYSHIYLFYVLDI